MPSYIAEENHPEAISIREQDHLIVLAEERGLEWSYDLGDDNDGNVVNFLIIEDGPMDGFDPDEDISF